MLDLVIPSPLDAHVVVLKVVGEIRYGPNYNRVLVDGVELAGVHVGDDPVWLSPQLLALQAWIHVAGRQGPDTCMLLIDAEQQLMFRSSVVECGIVHGFRLVGDTVYYRPGYYGPERPAEEELSVRITDRSKWEHYG